MPPKSLATIAAELVAATDVDSALRIVNDELALERHAGIVLLAFDGRRSTIIDRSMDRAVTPNSIPAADTPSGGMGRLQVAIDHLPAAVRQALLTGQCFTDVGDQPAQYARLLGIMSSADNIRLFLKGIVLDGALTAVLAVYEEGRRGGKLLQRAEPLAALFELVYARLFERSARFEAVSALHDITSNLRSEHAAALAQLQRDLIQLRTARGDVIDQARAEALASAAEKAHGRAVFAEERLAAVEQQVVNAVERLEQAHLQIYRQTEELQSQANTIRLLEEHMTMRS
jgi:hypothetical protein